ncbi:MAG TPA: DUF962 domain-containing protein [Woeseiaceae bacterium]|nr:DUF962 domain-containing protein [Woeseiaceae bacterium]
MSEIDGWLKRYRDNHQDLRLPLLFWTAVPMVIFGTVGLLWNLPVPEEFYEISPLLNWGSTFLMAAAVYYFILSLPLAIGLLPFTLGIGFLELTLQYSGYPASRVSIALLIAGIIGLWLGHGSNRRLWAMTEDLQTIMIGPAWLLSVVYRRLGIPF